MPIAGNMPPTVTTTTTTPAPWAPGSIGTRRVARYTFYNLLGLTLPVAASFLAAPLIVRALGADGFGVLSLLWVFIGYFSLFDFGIGKALTKVVAEKLGKGAEADVPTLVWSALLVMSALGLGVGLLLALISPTLINDFLQIPAALRPQALAAMYFVAISMPLVVGTAALRGVLEATQHFGVVNAIRIPMGVFSFVGPLLALLFSKDLAIIALWLVGGRIATWLAFMLACLVLVPSLRHGFGFKFPVLVPLLKFGGWMTVANLLTPLMPLLDRFLIGAMISTAAVAYYATPNDAVTKLWLVGDALLSYLFPAYAANYARNPSSVGPLFSMGLRYIYLLVFPAAIAVMAFAHEGLTLWLGADFAQKSTLALQWLAIGVFINAIFRVPYSLLQAVGRPDLTARLHMVELPIYLGVVWLLIGQWGIVGAAVAWTLRMLADTIVLFILCHKLIPGVRQIIGRLELLFALSAAVMTLGLIPVSLIERAAYLSFALATFCAVGWFIVLTGSERSALQKRLRLPVRARV